MESAANPALLASALEQAEDTAPAVHAAALLHAARVVSRSDPAAAVKMLERGIDLAQELAPKDRTSILGNALFLAAAVSPERALRLYAEMPRHNPYGIVGGLVNTMAQHGHVEAAVAYLDDPLPGDRFPFMYLGDLDSECRDDGTRLKLLRAAIRAWRASPPIASMPQEPFAGPAFAMFFARHSHLLPPEEAAAASQAIEEWARHAPDSIRAMLAAKRSDPKSVPEPEPVPESASETHISCEDVMTIGSCFGTEDDPPSEELIPMSEALANDFAAAFQEAFARYKKDTAAGNPNDAPKECWPSTREFRNILFKAAQHLGTDAAKYLDRIPDPDLRLLAQIDLCAAIAGLPQIGGTTIYQPRMSRRSGTEAPVIDPEVTQQEGENTGADGGGPRIRCPKCGWTPRAEDRWRCNCGHMWNTFDTGGVCPGCMYQWKITMCPRCHQWSAHSDWYTQ